MGVGKGRIVAVGGVGVGKGMMVAVGGMGVGVGKGRMVAVDRIRVGEGGMRVELSGRAFWLQARGRLGWDGSVHLGKEKGEEDGNGQKMQVKQKFQMGIFITSITSLSLCHLELRWSRMQASV